MDALESSLEFCRDCDVRRDYQETTTFLCHKLGVVALRDLRQGPGWIVLTGSQALLWMKRIQYEISNRN